MFMDFQIQRSFPYKVKFQFVWQLNSQTKDSSVRVQGKFYVY